ncbi:MAG: hypothetical protein LW808_003795 [Verrucomicrobiota bacterium]|nr:MAG: hypothetical protein LW808_003795 [Verrucomicrobiota bacterium]
MGLVDGSAKHTSKYTRAGKKVDQPEFSKAPKTKKGQKKNKNIPSLKIPKSISAESLDSVGAVDSNYWDSTQVSSNGGSDTGEARQRVRFTQQPRDLSSAGIGQSSLKRPPIILARVNKSAAEDRDSDHLSVPVSRSQLGAIPSFSCDDLLALAGGIPDPDAAHRRSSESSPRDTNSFDIAEDMLHRPAARGPHGHWDAIPKKEPYSLGQQRQQRGIAGSTSNFFGGYQQSSSSMQPHFMSSQGPKEPFPTFKPIPALANAKGRKNIPVLPRDRRPSRVAGKPVRYHARSPIAGITNNNVGTGNQVAQLNRNSGAFHMVLSARSFRTDDSFNNEQHFSEHSHAIAIQEEQPDFQEQTAQLLKNIEDWIESELDHMAGALRKLVIHCCTEAEEATISETFDCTDEDFDDFRSVCRSHKTRESLGFYNYAKRGVNEIMDRVNQRVADNVLRCLYFNNPQLKDNEVLASQVRGLVDYLAQPVTKKLTRTAFMLAVDVSDDVCSCCCGVWHKPKISKETKQQILSGIGNSLKGIAGLFIGDDLAQGACDLAGGIFNVIKDVCTAQVE